MWLYFIYNEKRGTAITHVLKCSPWESLNQQIWLSSPRYNVGTAMPILVDFCVSVSQASHDKSSITLLYFQMSRNGYPNPTTKIYKLSEIHGGKIKKWTIIRFNPW